MRRAWVYAGLMVVAATLFVGTGSFSATSADRGADAVVTRDRAAYLGIETLDTGDDIGDSFAVFELTDNFGTDVDLDSVRIVSVDPPVSLETDGPTPLDPTTDIRVTCEEATAGESVTFQFEASGDGGSVSVRVDKRVALSCRGGRQPSGTRPTTTTQQR